MLLYKKLLLMTFGTPLVYLYSFLSMSLNEGELLASCPGRFTLPKNPQYLLNRRLDGPQGRSGRFAKESNSLAYVRIRTPNVLF